MMISPEAQQPSEPIHLDWQMVPGVWLKQARDGNDIIEIVLPKDELHRLFSLGRNQLAVTLADHAQEIVASVATKNQISIDTLTEMFPGLIEELQAPILGTLVLEAIFKKHWSKDEYARYFGAQRYALHLVRHGRLVYTIADPESSMSLQPCLQPAG